MRITEAQLRNVGPFENEIIVFPEKRTEGAEIHLLVGVNGSGKSTALQTIAGNHHKLWSNGESSKSGALVKPILSTFQWQADEGVPRGDDPITSFRRMVTANSWPFHFAMFGYDGYRNIEGQGAPVDLNPPKGSPLENALFGQTLESPASALSNWVAQSLSKAALAESVGDKKKAGQFREEVGSLEEAISDILDEPFEFGFSYDPMRVWAKFRQRELDFEVLPDGLKSILGWLADILVRISRTEWVNKEIKSTEQSLLIFLDEVEVHLHPAWQRRILPVAKSLFPNAQIFVATHSPMVVGSIDGGWIHKLTIDANGLAKASEPILSEDGYSYAHIFSDIFGIKESFGVGVSKRLQEFKEMRNRALKGDVTIDALEKEAEDLAKESLEIEDIVGAELRQVKRRLEKAV